MQAEELELMKHDFATLMTMDEACRVLGLSRSAAYRAAVAGQIPTVRLGRRLFVPSARLLQLLGYGTREEDRLP